jgi:hypothetical protein
MVLRFLHSIFKAEPAPASKFDKTVIQAAIERVVDGTDPRLRAVTHYRRKLRMPVERAIDYVSAQIDVLPPAIDASRRGFTADPHLRALFASPEQLLEILSFSPNMRDCLQRGNGSPPPELYAALRAERIERNTLGIAMQGNQIQRDVPQITVLFQDPRLAFPNPSEAETRRELMNRAFDYLIEIALQRLVSLRARKQELEKRQRHLLQNKVGVLKAAGLGLGSLLTEPASGPAFDPAAIERQLAVLEAELGQIRADTATLDHHLALVAETLSEPEQHLRLDQVSFTLDHMNIKVDPDSARVNNTLTFREVRIGNQRRFIVLLVKFPSSELLEQPDFFAEAQRLLYLNDQPRLTTI